jgi:hypothetical protein
VLFTYTTNYDFSKPFDKEQASSGGGLFGCCAAKVSKVYLEL